MADVRDLIVRIKGDTSDFNKSMKDVGGSADDSGVSVKKLAGGVLLGNIAFAAGAKAVQGFGDVIRSTKENIDAHQAAVAQLDAVLQSTHGAAGLYKQDILDQSDALQKLTTYDNDAITSAANILLTFTNIKGAIFQQTLPAVLDLATAMHMDLQSASVMVGKAMQDPIHGMMALSRVGAINRDDFDRLKKEWKGGLVPVTQQQTELLQALNKEFKGSAQAAAGTFAGKVKQLKNEFGDAEKSVGTFLINAVTPMVMKLANFVQSDRFQEWLQKVSRFIKDDIAPAFNWIMTVAVPTLFKWGEEMFKVADKVFKFLQPSLDALFNTLNQYLIPALEHLWKNVIEPLVPIIGGVLVVAIWVVINALNIAIKVVSDVIGVLSSLIGWVIHTAGTIISWFSDIPTHIENAFKGLFNIITWPFRTAFNAVADFWNNTVGKLHWSIPKWIPGLGGHEIGAPQIPKLAAGGIVDSATVAMIGEGKSPEAVIPLDKLPDMVAQINAQQGGSKGGAAPNLHIEVNVGMYAGMPVEKRQIALELYKELVRAARAQGVQMPMIGAVGVQ